MPISSEPPRVAVIGGGITGLTAAYRLSQLAPQASVELFEASQRLGGVLSTHREDEYLIELGADNFLKKLPWAVDLCEELGLGEDILPTNPAGRRALVVRAGRLHPVPEGFVILQPHRFGPLLRSPLLSCSGKLRLLCERWISSPDELQQTDYDESVASFATRRLGRETFERLVQPLLAGIYTADPYQLSMAATMPDAIEAEREYGSLTRAILKQSKPNENGNSNADSKASGARYASFVTLRHGVGQLVDTLTTHLSPEKIHLNTATQSVAKAENQKWTVHLEDGAPRGPYDGVVVALPAPRASSLVETIDPKLGEQLGKILYASSAIVCMVFRRDQIAHDLDGFGFVVPSVEGRNIVAASFSSLKFPGRTPDDQVLIRVFLGGALQPDLVNLSDERLLELARADLSQLLGIHGESLRVDLARWHEKMPQYHVGHVQLIDAIEDRVACHDGLELAGNAYRGVGIPQCVRSGDSAARRLAARFQVREP